MDMVRVDQPQDTTIKASAVSATVVGRWTTMMIKKVKERRRLLVASLPISRAKTPVPAA